MDNLDGIENGVQSGMTAPQFLEKEPAGLVPGIEIRNLKKVFSTGKGKRLLPKRYDITV